MKSVLHYFQVKLDKQTDYFWYQFLEEYDLVFFEGLKEI